MKKAFFIIILVAIFFSCKRKERSSDILIKSICDTIKLDNDYEAELYVEHINSILPKFCIVHDKDTFILPFEENRDCAIFKAAGRKKGKMSYDGYVEFVDPKGNHEKESFSIVFYVK